MFTTTTAVRVNEGGQPVLTPRQLWHALQIRARNGDERFVPPGHRFEVLEDDGDALTRRVLRHGHEAELQRITFHGGRVMVFDFVEGPQQTVIVCALEVDGDGELWLRLTFHAAFRDLPHGSPAERAAAAERRPAMARQPSRIVAISRELAREGRI